jgi:hypothetical protein
MVSDLHQKPDSLQGDFSENRLADVYAEAQKAQQEI